MIVLRHCVRARALVNVDARERACWRGASTARWRSRDVSLLLAEWSVLAGNKKQISLLYSNKPLCVECFLIKMVVSLSQISFNPSGGVFRGYVVFCTALFCCLSLARSALAVPWDGFAKNPVNSNPHIKTHLKRCFIVPFLNALLFKFST